MQVVIALIVTPEGFPLAYEVLPGNTGDNTTLRAFLHKVESQYGRANCIWIMDRGIPTEEVLAEMRRADPPVSCLVGTPKGRLAKLEQALLGLPWLPRAVTFCCNQMAELTRLDWHSCQTENEVPPKPVVQKRRGKPPKPVDQFRLFPLRLGPDLDLQLEHWRSLRPKLAEARSVDELKDILDNGAVAAAPTCAALYPDNPRTT